MISVPEYELEAYPTNGIVGLPEGTLISSSAKASALIMSSQTVGRKKIPSWDMFKRWGFNVKKIGVISKKILMCTPIKEICRIRTARSYGRTDTQRYMRSIKGKKYWITAYETLQKLKFNLARTVVLGASEFNAYAQGREYYCSLPIGIR